MKKLTLSKNDRIIRGLAGGIAEYLNVNSMYVRLFFVVITFISKFWLAVIAYFVAATIISRNTPDAAYKQSDRYKAVWGKYKNEKPRKEVKAVKETDDDWDRF